MLRCNKDAVMAPISFERARAALVSSWALIASQVGIYHLA